MLQPDILKFHELAYAAFRMGQAAMCADAAQSSAAELARTRAAFAYYRSKVRTILDCPDI